MPTTDAVPPEPRMQPNIKAILELIGAGGPIEQAEKKQGEALTTTGKLFQRIEKDMHGNRAAVSAVRRMQKMSDDKRADFLRTLEPLMVELGYTVDDIEPDLADRAGKTAETDDEGEKPDASSTNQTASPLEAARRHLNGGAQTEEEVNDVVRNITAGKKLSIASPKTGGGPQKDLG